MIFDGDGEKEYRWFRGVRKACRRIDGEREGRTNQPFLSSVSLTPLAGRHRRGGGPEEMGAFWPDALLSAPLSPPLLPLAACAPEKTASWARRRPLGLEVAGTTLRFLSFFDRPTGAGHTTSLMREF